MLNTNFRDSCTGFALVYFIATCCLNFFFFINVFVFIIIFHLFIYFFLSADIPETVLELPSGAESSPSTLPSSSPAPTPAAAAVAAAVAASVATSHADALNRKVAPALSSSAASRTKDSVKGLEQTLGAVDVDDNLSPG
jgi:hypothetical protein